MLAKYNKIQEFLVIKITIMGSHWGKKRILSILLLSFFNLDFFLFHYSVKAFKLYIYYLGTKTRMLVLTHRVEMKLDHHIEKILH